MALNYKIATLNVPFDMGYKNVLRFDDRKSQEQYFKVEELFKDAVPVNFDMGNLLTTTIYYDCDTTDIIRLLSYNYAIVKCETPDKVLDYMYYFIANASFDSYKRVRLDLVLDVFQTFYMEYDFSECFISRAHLDRFIERSGGKYYFNLRADSPLFERESINNLPQRFVSRQELFLKFDTSSESRTPLENWMYNNVVAWIYFYMPQGEYEEGDDKAYFFNTNIIYVEGADRIAELPYVVGVIPLMTENSTASFVTSDGSIRAYWSAQAMEQFISSNAAKIYNIKISAKPPFSIRSYSASEYNIRDDNYIEFLNATTRTIIPGNITMLNWDNFAMGLHFGTQSSVVQLLSINNTNNGNTTWSTSSLNNLIGRVFEKSDIVGAEHNRELNPKLLGADYQHLELTDGISACSYDISKLGAYDNNKFEYNESITADITKAYARIYNSVSPVYTERLNSVLLGLIISNDNSIPYAQNQLDTFLANNKNFYMQRDIAIKTAQRSLDVGLQTQSISQLASLVGSVGAGAVEGTKAGPAGAAAGAAVGALSGVTGAIAGIGTTAINYAWESEKIQIARTQSDLTLDNMRNAPEVLAGGAGNVLFNLAITGIGIFIDKYSALDNELIMADDYMNMNGFTYNRIGKIKDFDKTRKYFNFVQATVEEVVTSNPNMAQSNIIRDTFKQMFLSGVRMWHDPENYLQYDLENYERYLDEL